MEEITTNTVPSNTVLSNWKKSPFAIGGVHTFKVVGFFFIRGQQLSEGSVYCGDVGVRRCRLQVVVPEKRFKRVGFWQHVVVFSG